jgi:hypothetical protein
MISMYVYRLLLEWGVDSNYLAGWLPAEIVT